MWSSSFSHDKIFWLNNYGEFQSIDGKSILDMKLEQDEKLVWDAIMWMSFLYHIFRVICQTNRRKCKIQTRLLSLDLFMSSFFF